MKNSNRIITGIIAVALGVMFITAKSQSIQIALSVVGAALLIMAIIDFAGGEKVKAVFKAIAAVGVVVFGWIFVHIALYLIAAMLILYGILQLIFMLKIRVQDLPKFNKILAFAKPVASLVAGGVLAFNTDGALTWIFVFTGILITLEGLLLLIDKTGYAD